MYILWNGAYSATDIYTHRYTQETMKDIAYICRSEYFCVCSCTVCSCKVCSPLCDSRSSGPIVHISFPSGLLASREWSFVIVQINAIAVYNHVHIYFSWLWMYSVCMKHISEPQRDGLKTDSHSSSISLFPLLLEATFLQQRSDLILPLLNVKYSDFLV